MGIEQSKFTYKNFPDEKKVLSIRSFELTSGKSIDTYLDDPYYLTKDYYSKILLLEDLIKKQKDTIFIYPINIDSLYVKLIIKKNDELLYECEVKKENFIKSIKIIDEVFTLNRRSLGLNNSRINRKEGSIIRFLRRFESEDENSQIKTLEEIKKINIEIEELEKKKLELEQKQNNPSPQIQEKKNNILDEYEKVLLNNFELKSNPQFAICSNEIAIFDYSNFSVKSLNIESEFRFNNLSNDEIVKKIDQMIIYNESFSYFIKNSLSENRIYFIRNFEENDRSISFSIIKNNELITYSGNKSKLKEFLDENFKDEKFYIVESLDNK